MKTLFAKALTFLLDGESSVIDEKFKWIEQVASAIDLCLWPILIVVGAAGSIYAIVLGVNMARADSTEKREEAKKRVVNVLIGMIIIVALILLFKLFVAKDNGILFKFIGDNKS